MSDWERAVVAELSSHRAFEERGDHRYAVTTVAFDAEVLVASDRLEVTVRAPMLSAVVEGDVADVVEEGWFETFERRMGDASMALVGELDAAPRVERQADELVVEATVEDPLPDRAVGDAKALAEYAEGTYLEGVIPGYDYGEPVASMRERSHQRY